MPVASQEAGAGRRNYLDWLRGVAVLIMIEGHLLDSWTAVVERETQPFRFALIIAGIGAPLFLFLAGVSVSLSASARLRRTGDVSAASRAVVRRGFQIFALAFVFRAQAWILGWSSPWTLLKVDILNIMGPSIVAAAALWGVTRSTGKRLFAFVLVSTATGVATPLVRSAGIDWLPDPVEAYITPVAGLSNFVFFPSAGFVFAGAATGLLLDRTSPVGERRLNAWLLATGIVLAGGALAASYLPSPFRESSFWTSSPSYYFIRVGVLTAAVGLAYVWESRPGGATRWSPLRQLGRASLFIYWIHVEMLYGLISEPLHKALTFRQALVAFVLFSLFMLLCSTVKDGVVERWSQRPKPGPATTG